MAEQKAEQETIFILTREDVLRCAAEMGIPEDAITDDVIENVKKGVSWGFFNWDEVVKSAINYALKN